MPSATDGSGNLVPLSQCYITIPTSNNGGLVIPFNVLPDISDSKSAEYTAEPVIGRSAPLKTYANSGDRAISLQIHLIAQSQADIGKNLQILRAIQSLVYPRDQNLAGNAPYLPPYVCSLTCGQLLSSSALCVILRSYSVRFPTDVPWDYATYIPWKFDIDTNWEAVYTSSNLPGQERIISDFNF